MIMIKLGFLVWACFITYLLVHLYSEVKEEVSRYGIDNYSYFQRMFVFGAGVCMVIVCVGSFVATFTL